MRRIIAAGLALAFLLGSSGIASAVSNDLPDWQTENLNALSSTSSWAQFTFLNEVTGFSANVPLGTLGAGLIFSGVYLSAAARTASTEGRFDVQLVDVTHSKTLTLWTLFCSPPTPCVMNLDGPYDVRAAALADGFTLGDTLQLTILITDLVGIGHYDLTSTVIIQQQT